MGGLQISENALKVLEKRYLLKNEKGEIVETPEGMFRRVAKSIAMVEKNYPESPFTQEELEEKFYNIMTEFYFLPNSPTLMNAGTTLGQLSACFVLPINDSMNDIFEAIKRTAIIHKTGGGTGFSFSRLRPKNDIVKSTGGVASGPISFMRVFNEATEAVKQGGRRRGANMGILRVDHPDIMEFIECKAKEGDLANFNISVAVTDLFMEALEKGKEYTLINPRNGEAVGSLSPKEVFDKMVYYAWKNGEPGIIFIDTINKSHPLRGVGEIDSTNPCGEQPLLPYESCNLGSINLSKFVNGIPAYLENRMLNFEEAVSRIDWEKLRDVVHLSVHFLDNVVDANHFPFDEIRDITLANRKIGLGVMGFADMLLKLGIPYTSEAAPKIAEKVMSFISKEASIKSSELAKYKGSFPNIDKSIYKGPMRNGTLTTIAPTGSLSMIAECSSGIEPIFSLAYTKTVLGNESLLYINPYFEEAAKEMGFYSKELMEEVASLRSIKDFESIPSVIRQIFVTTFDVEPMQHVKIQAAFQKHVDNAVSKTINLPNDAKPEDIATVYREAYYMGLKGLTVYRDGSREEQVIRVAKETAETRRPPYTVPRPRPETTKGRTLKMVTDLGNCYVTINEDEYGIFEVFIYLGKSGSQTMAFTEAIGRLISLSVRSGVPVSEVIKQLKGIKSSNPVRQENGEVIYSVPDAIAKAIEKYLERGVQLELIPTAPTLKPILDIQKRVKKGEESERLYDICPECGGRLVYQEGCFLCVDCGYSRCE
ncbi:MAG TPA: vitamin B12-dependent ribonucleotide reductase [Candidatus Hydrothermia bacterium]|nr:vitamin B12-dependent ribonucleotide reductase [Candidatus Hydrothermia bacterium]